MRIRDEVETFRETIDREIALNLYTYDVRVRQHGCIVDVLGQVERWLGQARSGDPVPGMETSGPYTLSPYRSAWDNRNAAVFQHLPAALRKKYAEFYDELDNNSRLITVEAEAWNRLNPYAEPGPLPLRDRRTIRAIIKQVPTSMRRSWTTSRCRAASPGNWASTWRGPTACPPSSISASSAAIPLSRIASRGPQASGKR